MFRIIIIVICGACVLGERGTGETDTIKNYKQNNRNEITITDILKPPLNLDSYAKDYDINNQNYARNNIHDYNKIMKPIIRSYRNSDVTTGTEAAVVFGLSQCPKGRVRVGLKCYKESEVPE